MMADETGALLQGAPVDGGQQQQPVGNWYDTLGLSDEDKGLIQVKNFKNANDLIKSYRDIEKFTGVDKNELIRIPKAKEGEEPDYSSVFKALGRPDDAKGYELPDNDFAKAAAEKFLELGLSKKQAKALTEWVDGYSTNQQEANTKALAEQAERAVKEQKESLQKSWGAKYDENLEIARQAVADYAQELNLSTEVLDKIGDAVGLEVATKLFYELGKNNGGDGSKRIQNYINGNHAETPETAKYKLRDMYADPEIAKKISAGDEKTIRELNRLNAIVAEQLKGNM